MRFGAFLSALVLVNAFMAEAHAAAPWRTDAVAARADALKAGKLCVLILNSDTRALCGHIKSVEAALQPSAEIAALREKAVLAVARREETASSGLGREFEVIGLYAWIVVLDGKGELLASYMADSTGLPCAEEAKPLFAGRVAERIAKALEIKASLQALERAWRENPSDAAAFEALARSYSDCTKPRAFAALCERELANAKLDASAKNLLRLYRFLAKVDPMYAFGGGDAERQDALRAEAEGLLTDLPNHARTPDVEAALFETYAGGVTFDVPGKIAAVAAKLRARAKDAPNAADVDRRAKSLEDRAARWKKAAEEEAAKPGHDVFIDVRLGDAKRTIGRFGGDEPSRNYYRELLGEAQAKLERENERK